MDLSFQIIPFFGILALLYTFWKTSWIKKQDPGTEKMQKISQHIAEGAMAFLKAEYRVLAVFILFVALLLAYSGLTADDSSPLVGVSFVVGVFCSALAGFIGMSVATKANVRTTNAARTGVDKALKIAFTGGSVMGMGVVGLGVLGLGTLFLIYGSLFGLDSQEGLNKVIVVITGFSFGASSIALFARVGGGIYTKAADVGADLVGKVEAGIHEDHPLNPATIADNVGDNVGDVAGMGADLFESYVGSIVGAMVLGAAAGSVQLVVLPLALAGAGILVSVIGTFLVRTREGGDPQMALNLGTFGAGLAMAALTYPIVVRVGPATFTLGGVEYSSMGIFGATITGLLAGIGIGLLTEYYTAEKKG